MKDLLKLNFLNQLTSYHQANCISYGKILSSFANLSQTPSSLESIPFIPVGLFKHVDLLSIPRESASKIMNSSGTTGQSTSKIFLDRTNSVNQTKTLAKIVSERVGVERAPLLIIDSPNIVLDRNNFSARGAGILGFSMFGRPVMYALNPDMSLNTKIFDEFLSHGQNSKKLLYGFTSIIWEHFILKLSEMDIKTNLKDATLIHGGGWKKLAEANISNRDFTDRLFSVTGITSSINYYGMVEQTGSIYMECEVGYLHTSAYNDLLIRQADDFSIANLGQKGLIQVLSLLPTSYPGHSILTEDVGTILGDHGCKCGRSGKFFVVEGRLKKAEIRGCSDTYSSQFG